MKQIELELWTELDEDPNEPPFIHSIVSSKCVSKIRVKAPSSVFDLAKHRVKITLEQDDQPKEWARDGDKVIGWGEVRRIRWEETERDRKSKTIPPKTPNRARTKGRMVREIDGGST